jgi:hypothetical protein
MMKAILTHFKKLKGASHQKGSALVEVLIGAMMIGVGVAAIIEVSSQSLNTYKKADNTASFNSLYDRIDSWISNEQTCRLAFGGPSTINPLSGESVNLQSIPNLPPPNNAGSKEILIYKPVQSLLLSDRPKFAAKNLDLSTDGQTKDNAAWVFRSIALSPTSGAWVNGKPNPAEVTITAVPRNSGKSITNASDSTNDPRMRTFAGQIPKLALTLVLDSSGNVLTCGPLNFNSYNAYDPTNPEWSLAPVQPCPADFAPQSPDGIHIRCIRVNCAAGKSITGYDQETGVICN